MEKSQPISLQSDSNNQQIEEKQKCFSVELPC